MKLKDDEKEEILAKFSDFMNEIHYDPEIEAEYMPHYIIYKKISKKLADCYCTHCHKWHQAPVLARAHGEKGKCSECGYDVTYLCEGYGRKKIYSKRNFVRFKVISKSEVIAIAINVRAKFYNPNCSVIVNSEDVELDYDYEICNLYYFTKGQAYRFRKENVSKFWPEVEYKWVETVAMREPVFEKGFMGWNVDNSYTVMDKDEEVLGKSFLKYVAKYADENNINISCDCARAITLSFIKYLVACSVHPNAEYLMSAGFSSIMSAYISGSGMYGLRVNWRSDNLNKMLGLAKNDIKVLRDHPVHNIAKYKEIKKYFKGKASPEQLIECVDFGADNIKYICEKTGLSLSNVLDYSKTKIGTKSALLSSRVRDWKDYIEQCIKLGYNLDDTAISKPRKLNDAHERLSKIISFEEDKKQNGMIAKRYEELQKLCYEDKKLGIKIVIPKTTADIVEEGKRQNHCVGGYAKRHAEGELAIVFLRSIRKPDVPYYTLEISNKGQIVQCRGYRNNSKFEKPEKIKKFEAKYQEYLDTIYSIKKNKKVGKSA